jgi:aryl-alcohol dehydrogenase-like predicted oxidoreductase
MKYGKVPGIDKQISRVVHGTIATSSKELDKSFALLDSAIEHGINTFDTAHVYGSGDNERTVGRWVNDRGIRDKIVIIGKGAHHSSDRERVTPWDITSDIHDSLARFKFDYIDLYLLHRDDPTQPVGPIIETLNEHLAAGRIRAIGGSNWKPQRIQAANEYAQTHGLTPFIASSPNFSLAEQYKEPWPNCISISGPAGADDREWYTKEGIALFTWSSLAGGFFSGRFNRDNLDQFETYGDKLVVHSYCGEDNFRRLDRVRELAAEKGVTVAQIALAFVLSQPANILALTAGANDDEIRANVEAGDITLSPAELDWLDLKRDDR